MIPKIQQAVISRTQQKLRVDRAGCDVDEMNYENALQALLDENLPADFAGWGLCEPRRPFDGGPHTLAHYAAKRGLLPDGFECWGLVNGRGETVAHVALERGPLPSSFDRWELKGAFYESVAHVAAKIGRLPRGFALWGLMNDYGNTVAHSAAYAGLLPDDFDRWELRAADLSTVAHAAAFAGKLPERFSAWHLQDGFGETVAGRALRHGRMGSEYARRYAAYQAEKISCEITRKHQGRGAANEGGFHVHVARSASKISRFGSELL